MDLRLADFLKAEKEHRGAILAPYFKPYISQNPKNKAVRYHSLHSE